MSGWPHRSRRDHSSAPDGAGAQDRAPRGFRLSRRARWAVPAGALVVTGGILAGSLISVAGAAPGLPAKTPAQLLAAAADSATPPLTGTVVETAALGLPALPSGLGATSIASLLTGSHTVRLWYASPQHFRLALPGQLSETDVIRDGSTAWLWQSSSNSAEEYSVPAGRDATVPAQPLTPAQATQEILAKVGKTTAVSVATNVTVAGQAAYELVLSPKDSRSLVGQVAIAIDGRNGVPLRLQVFARGASTPSFQVGYTAIQFVTPAQSELRFTPPPGAHVTRETGQGQMSQDGTPSDVVTSGTDWLTVAELPSADILGGGPGKNPGAAGGGEGGEVLQALLGSATSVQGSWGTGRLLRTSLISVLMTSDGRTFLGAVQPSVLYAAAAAAHR